MKGIGARFGPAIEWALAAAFLIATVAAGTAIVRELRTVSIAVPTGTRESPPPAPEHAGVPARAVSVPVLLLPNGKEVHLDDTATQIAERLGRAAEVGSQVVEARPDGERLTRFYDYSGVRFALVFAAPPGDRGEPRVAAIFIL